MRRRAFLSRVIGLALAGPVAPALATTRRAVPILPRPTVEPSLPQIRLAAYQLQGYTVVSRRLLDDAIYPEGAIFNALEAELLRLFKKAIERRV